MASIEEARGAPARREVSGAAAPPSRAELEAFAANVEAVLRREEPPRPPAPAARAAPPAAAAAPRARRWADFSDDSEVEAPAPAVAAAARPASFARPAADAAADAGGAADGSTAAGAKAAAALVACARCGKLLGRASFSRRAWRRARGLGGREESLASTRSAWSAARPAGNPRARARRAQRRSAPSLPPSSPSFTHPSNIDPLPFSLSAPVGLRPAARGSRDWSALPAVVAAIRFADRAPREGTRAPARAHSGSFCCLSPVRRRVSHPRTKLCVFCRILLGTSLAASGLRRSHCCPPRASLPPRPPSLVPPSTFDLPPARSHPPRSRGPCWRGQPARRALAPQAAPHMFI
ncbi:unnamed protein product [Prorocentrum cordatum]|uniref:Uncharacterized protein n=1 Tax=Prorocentrum cordatum TaxID=2364126 RepID=A0ABN9PHP1_9DINO|nr:unnamed protein product [Polarella glacialis]